MERIDAILTRGSGFAEGKMRIYEQFQKSLSPKENADFLKDEYGLGGYGPVIIGSNIDENHSGKGLTISKGFGENAPKVHMNWQQVAKRISELIQADRYLNHKEKEIYPQWLEAQEQRRAELAIEAENRKTLSTAPTEKEDTPKTEYRYEYNIGDKVYVGASEYEILAFDDEQVRLYDTQYPLFNKEFSRSEFDNRVRGNPLNDHLKVVAESEIVSEVQEQERLSISITFSEHPAFYDQNLNDRYTELNFPLANKLLGILDEKQHRDREVKDYVGFYHKTYFTINAAINGNEFMISSTIIM